MEYLEPQRPETKLGRQGQKRQGSRTQRTQGPAKLRCIFSIFCCWCTTWIIRAQGFGFETGTQGSHLAELIDCTSTATAIHARGCGQFLEGGPADPKFEEETGTTTRSPTQCSGEEGRAVDGFQDGDQGARGKRKGQIRSRQPGTQEGNPRDPDTAGSGHEWDATNHHGTGGREPRNRRRGSFHGHREGQGDKAGEEQPHGGGNPADASGPADACPTIVDITTLQEQMTYMANMMVPPSVLSPTRQTMTGTLPSPATTPKDTAKKRPAIEPFARTHAPTGPYATPEKTRDNKEQAKVNLEGLDGYGPVH